MNSESDVDVSASSVSYWHVLVRTLVQTPIFFFHAKSALRSPGRTNVSSRCWHQFLRRNGKSAFRWGCGAAELAQPTLEAWSRRWCGLATKSRSEMRHTAYFQRGSCCCHTCATLVSISGASLSTDYVAQLREFQHGRESRREGTDSCPAIASPSADLEATFVFRPVYHGLLISEDVFLSHSIFSWTAKGAWVTNWVLRIGSIACCRLQLMTG